MRRSRIKVQATVPIRRKVLQENAITDSNKPPSTSNSTSDVEKSTQEKELKIEKINNTPKSRTETEKPAESVVQTEKEPINNLPAPTPSSENEGQNTDQESREKSGVIVCKVEHNDNVDKQSDSIQVNKETDDSVVNKEPNNVETNKEINNVQTEADPEINKQVDIVEGNNKQYENLNVKTQEVPTSQIEANPPKHLPNRSCFMRPVPRLDSGGRVRKNSVQGSGASASESEDDSKKSSIPTRVRNDSICSVQSNKEGSSNAHGVAKLKLGQQKRRLTVSESARKLAEARREFMLKHENKTPDRSKLTMYDLIYYNPVSNPMTKPDNATPPPRKISVCSTVPEDTKEEEEDEPTAMPVPRVKVGPDGQLIVDEKSLIIERTEKEKNRSGPIVHDESNGGGFYKRRQKSKDWSKWDTLRFYKALSNIGTDFLLMQRFFPKRTRQELKLKFKKEERMNRKLVEQALKCQVFDMEALKEEMDVFAENERKETEIIKSKTDGVKKHKSKRPAKCRFVVGSIEEIGNSCEEDVDDDLSSGESRDEGAQKKSKKSSKRKRKSPNPSVIVHDQETESSSDTEDMEIYNVKPTRSGRLPKRRKLQAPNVEGSDDSSDSEEEESLAKDPKSSAYPKTEQRVDSQPQDIIANLIPNARDIEPGSLVILTRESPGEPGKTVVQVYMVSKNYNANDPNSEQNMTPVNLSPELLATVNSKISETEPVRVKPEVVNSKE